MSYNYDACGYKSVNSFVGAMKSGEKAQLSAFVAFVKNRHIADELAQHDWVGFARIYNGAGYAAKGYHLKLAEAYAKYRGQAYKRRPTSGLLDVAQVACAAYYLLQRLRTGKLARNQIEPDKVPGLRS